MALLMTLDRSEVYQPTAESPSLVPATVGGSSTSVTAASAIGGLAADFARVSRFTATAGILGFSVKKNRAYT